VFTHRRLRAASEAFGRACAPVPACGRPILGLEHEFVVARAGGPIDFRSIIHRLGLGQRHLDPADPNAYRRPSGAAWTCDGAEAEIALPPRVLEPGAGRRIAAGAAAERGALAATLAALSPPLVPEGCSTHLSVSLPDERRSLATAERFARRFAAGLMLLMDGPASPGLLVRPRPGRLELGGEYVTGRSLRAALMFAAGATLASHAAARTGREALPPALDVRLAAATQRFGWYVDRRAFGPDLYAIGRATVVRTADGRTVRAQDHLERAWAAVRSRLEPFLGAGDLEPTDRVVAGDEPLPLETSRRAPGTDVGADSDDLAAPDGTRAPGDDEANPFGAVIRPVARPGFDLAPVMVTWDLGVLVVADRARSRQAFVAIPRPWLATYLSALVAGRLDAPIAAYLAHPPAGRRLARRNDARSPGLFDELGLRGELLPAERGPDGRPAPHPRDGAARRSLGRLLPIHTRALGRMTGGRST
jgi:hypothetical protein